MTTRKLLVGALCLVSFSLFGCASGPVQTDDLRARFAFEAACPLEQVSTTELRPPLDRTFMGAHGAQYGVSGCGQRGVYLYDGNHGWVNNSAGGEEPAEGQPVRDDADGPISSAQ